MAEGRHELVLELGCPFSLATGGSLAGQQRLEPATHERRRADEYETDQDGRDQDSFASESGGVFFGTAGFEQVSLRRIQVGGYTTEGGHELGARPFRHVGERGPIARSRRMDGLLQIFQLRPREPRKLCRGRSGAGLIGAQTPQLIDCQTNLRDGRVVLRQVRGVARQQETPLVGLRVRQGAIEVIEGLQNVIGALDLGARVGKGGQLGVTDEADREDRAERTQEGNAP